MKNNETFNVFDGRFSGLLFSDKKHEKYPINYYNIINQFDIFSGGSSYYVYVYQGTASLNILNSPTKTIGRGEYFSTSTPFNMVGTFKAIVIQVFQERGIYPENKYKAMTLIGGPIEEQGRLKYIDGCTDSILIPPVKLGDPCLNHLHFPNNIDQTPHTHPSHRIGIVAKGRGECITPFGNLPLTEGTIFIIKEYDGKSKSKGLDGKIYENGTHSFRTFDESMDVIAFHPDSDFGPQDENHPMINRTIVGGVSANSIEEIKTK